MEIIQQGVQASTPWARPSEWARFGWTKECSEAIQESRRLFHSWRDSQHDSFQKDETYSKEYRESRCEEDHAAYRSARNFKGKAIAKASRQGFRSWLKKTTEEGPRGMWKVGKWARNRGGDVFGVIPALKTSDDQLAESNESKVEVLRNVFFPAPPAADLSDISYDSIYHLPFPPITEQEVGDVIRRAPPDKAPGPDMISNRIWKLLVSGCDQFIRILTSIFDACIRTGYNPRHFQESTTVTLRKGGPRDYLMPKSYRPIALMNTLGKLLEAVVASRISYAVEEHSLLPKTHLGGRKGLWQPGSLTGDLRIDLGGLAIRYAPDLLGCCGPADVTRRRRVVLPAGPFGPKSGRKSDDCHFRRDTTSCGDIDRRCIQIHVGRSAERGAISHAGLPADAADR
ncbi:uncharacterized protein N7483_008156 [Penicillium malachiteum]|uniref:uncharacterized protein n=1 Tax=Penicillium malachiteum TaxID=1324776 RepID=UPI002547D611|nr:uncharacterized protein N7483_008156 [Penicillium malachiteum]KAJ5720222.1 hypothetical protein N7483_008156 [Penicillium malachiteum]